MATLFIADLHLQTEEPAITAGFLRFLRGEAKSADALYILGDLFEAGLATMILTRCIVKSPPPLRRWLIPVSPAISFTATVIFCSASATPAKAA